MRASSDTMLACIGAAALGAMASCSLPGSETSFRSNDPSARTRALARAVEQGDRSAVPDLIDMLSSEDPGVRMLANAALIRLTGEDFGFIHGAPRAERNAAIDRWVQWAATSTDAGSGAGDPRS